MSRRSRRKRAAHPNKPVTRSRRESRIIWAAILVIAFAYLATRTFHGVPSSQGGHGARDLGRYRVLRVVDGDTIVVDILGKIRLIGMDTPETVDPRRPVQYYGKEASDATTRMALGRLVRVERDVEERDQYGRLLAYIWLPDGKMLNAELVRQGYARVYTFPPNVKYEATFVRLERDARNHDRGLWR